MKNPIKTSGPAVCKEMDCPGEPSLFLLRRGKHPAGGAGSSILQTVSSGQVRLCIMGRIPKIEKILFYDPEIRGITGSFGEQCQQAAYNAEKLGPSFLEDMFKQAGKCVADDIVTIQIRSILGGGEQAAPYLVDPIFPAKTGKTF